MKTVNVNVLKKNRKYFAATLDRGYKCKILITEASKSLKLGSQSLAVEDISVRTKYGTDLIYRMDVPAETQEKAGICTLCSPYNSNLVTSCRKLGGRWDADASAWIFPDFVADQVDVLDEKYNSPLVTIDITFPEGTWANRGPVTIAGYPIARAYGRDSGAKLSAGVALLTGHVSSGGSVKNWTTDLSEGAVIRMKIPEMCLPAVDASWARVAPGADQ